MKRHSKTIVVTGVLVLICACTLTQLSPSSASNNTYQWMKTNGTAVQTTGTHQWVTIKGTTGQITKTITPQSTYTYIPVSGTLKTSQMNNWDPYDPSSINVHINSVSPSGKLLNFIVTVGGDQVWSGSLGAGQTSPTLTCNSIETCIWVTNANSVLVQYSGTINLTNN
jgi:hypothetical protein